MIFFSIIIPTYNRAELIGRTILSVVNQSFQNLELIVVDDGSTDRTGEIIKSFDDPRIRYFKIQNSERAAARNYGLKQAVGKYVNYFDSDDIMNSDRLQLIFDHIQNEDQQNVIYTHFDYRDEYGQIVHEMRTTLAKFTGEILNTNFLAVSSVVLSRSAALCNPFHEDRKLTTAEDWELWLRIHSQFEFSELPIKTFSMTQHSDRSLSGITTVSIVQRDEYFAHLIKSNAKVVNKFGRNAINLFVADRLTFIALAYAEENSKLKSLLYLLKAFTESISVLYRKRFWAVLKKFFWN